MCTARISKKLLLHTLRCIMESLEGHGWEKVNNLYSSNGKRGKLTRCRLAYRRTVPAWDLEQAKYR